MIQPLEALSQDFARAGYNYKSVRIDLFYDPLYLYIFVLVYCNAHDQLFLAGIGSLAVEQRNSAFLLQELLGYLVRLL